jgi:dnd system-associated protein 4
MAIIHIPKELSDVADRLGRKNIPKTGKSVFPTLMQLMVFSALLAKKEGLNRVEVKGKDKGPEIDSEIFARNELDGVAYLLALQETKNGEILRDNKETECWKIMEEYAASGLDYLNTMLINNAGDIEGVDTILNYLKDEATNIIKKGENVEVNLTEIEF